MQLLQLNSNSNSIDDPFDRFFLALPIPFYFTLSILSHRGKLAIHQVTMSINSVFSLTMWNFRISDSVDKYLAQFRRIVLSCGRNCRSRAIIDHTKSKRIKRRVGLPEMLAESHQTRRHSCRIGLIFCIRETANKIRTVVVCER